MAPLSRNDIPLTDQHEFLDLAKEFSWADMKKRIIDEPQIVCVQPCGRWSALHQAAYGGSVEAVNFLLEHHAPLDAKTSDGKTPLQVAKTASVKAVLQKAMGLSRSPNCKPTAKKAMKLGSTKNTTIVKAKKKTIARGKRGKTLVYRGRFEKTVGGLTKDSLTKNKFGKIVSKRLQAHGCKSFNNIKGWIESLLKARTELGLSGFVAVKKGSLLYAKTIELYRA